ncbi:DNA/RNA polymerase [Martensiomyces pterosporus]|nr:DNA/RNA polymerase [Martensiomyces pterosporus]
MNQLVLRALKSTRTLQGKVLRHTPTRTAQTLPICLLRLQSPNAPANTRSFSQKYSLKAQQHVEAAKEAHAMEESDKLFAPANNSLISMVDMREDTELLHYLQTGKSLTEQLSVMQACLLNGNVERAQRILVGMYKLYPDAMKEVADVSVHNEIIGGLLNAKPQPLTTEALLWYDQMERHYKVKPNTNTFAILISGFVRCGMRNVAVVLMQELLRCGYNFRELLLSSYLSDTDIDQIKDVAGGILHETPENGDVARKLLDAVNDAEEKLRVLSNESKPSEHQDVGEEQSDTRAADSAEQGSDAARKESKVAPAETRLDSTNVSGIQQLQDALKSLYTSDLEGYNLQLRLERDTYDAALTRYREINKKRGDPLLTADTSRLKKVSASWLPQLESLVEEEQERCRQAEEDNSDRVRAQYGRFLLQLDPPKLAIITILEVLRLNATDNKGSSIDTTNRISGLKTTTIVTALSTAVHNEIRFERMKRRTNRHIAGRNVSVAKLASSGKLFNMAVRRAKAHEVKENSNQDWLDSWDISTKMRIGSLLLSMLIEAARIPEHYSDPATGQMRKHMVPAFTHDYMMIKGRKYGIVSAHSSLRELFRQDSIVGVMNARHLPMLVPPRPWLTYNSGGYLTQNEPCMRMKESSEQLRYLKKASNEDRLFTLLAGLDSLGLTKWAINRPVFDAVRKVWNSGRELAEIPPRSYDVPEPVKPENYETDDKAKLKYRVEMREWTNGRANQHSQRCDCNYKVEIAQAFLSHPMYFPHNMDFRGRAYPIPPHFNHLGNDLCRGLLLFHEGRALTERGLYWLKIHLANLCGKDKLSHEDRLRFVDDNIKDIMASADDPVPDAFLSGEPGAARPWWLNAEDPWQALAACIEFTAAMRSPNPAEYVSHLHVHQDGTCNGLQHYAAMGRDRKGAREVNLLPSERPQDVYSGILKVVMRLVDEDAQNGVEEAVLLRGKLTRKIVKQTVMTNVYGVTLIGAKDQIAARLRELKDDAGQHVFDVLAVSKLAMYVAKKIFDSLGEMFTQAQQIQSWLNESARRIAKSMPVSALAAWKRMILESKESQEKFRAALRNAKDEDRVLDNATILELRPDLGPGAMRRRRLNNLATKPMTTVVWTTPLGLTVVQPYRKYVTRMVTTSLQSIAIHDSNMPSPVNSQKQKTAFPPNFVHSLDASHMILSAIECKKENLVFASVHDSYWTHACDVDTMNRILRDQFVRLHQRPIMDNLKTEFEERYKDHKMPVVRWEYVNKDAFSDGGKIKARRGRKPKQTERDEQEKLVEKELARHHLEFCGEGESVSADGIAHHSDMEADYDADHADIDAGEAVAHEEGAAGAAAANAESQAHAGPKPATATATATTCAFTASLETVDLASISLIDPRKDLVGAARQADLIAYTISVNKEKMAAEVAKARADYKARAKKLSALAKPTVKVISKAKPNSKADTGSAETQPPALSKAEATEKTKTLKAELAAAISKIESRYEYAIAPPKLMSSPAESPDQFARTEEMIKDGQLAGRFVKRVEWVDIEFDPLPDHGDFDINEVMDSPYFFS